MNVQRAITVIVLIVMSMTMAACQTAKNFYLDRKSPPDPQDRKIVAARAMTQVDIETSFAAIERRVSLTKHAAFSRYEFCNKGENTFKREDGYAYRCQTRITRYYGMDGDFIKRMLDFEDQLRAEGWSVPSVNMRTAIDGDRDTRFAMKLNGDCNTAGKKPRRCKFQVSNFTPPYEAYRNNDLKLWFLYLDAQSILADFDSLEYLQYGVLSGFKTYEDKSVQDVRAIFGELMQTHAYLLAISIQSMYYQN